jgi:hypothetical protein
MTHKHTVPMESIIYIIIFWSMNQQVIQIKTATILLYYQRSHIICALQNKTRINAIEHVLEQHKTAAVVPQYAAAIPYLQESSHRVTSSSSSYPVRHRVTDQIQLHTQTQQETPILLPNVLSSNELH